VILLIDPIRVRSTYSDSSNAASIGALMMTSSFGQVFEGSINSQHRITGQLTGYCSYDLTWQKQS